MSLESGLDLPERATDRRAREDAGRAVAGLVDRVGHRQRTADSRPPPPPRRGRRVEGAGGAGVRRIQRRRQSGRAGAPARDPGPLGQLDPVADARVARSARGSERGRCPHQRGASDEPRRDVRVRRRRQRCRHHRRDAARSLYRDAARAARVRALVLLDCARRADDRLQRLAGGVVLPGRLAVPARSHVLVRHPPRSAAAARVAMEFCAACRAGVDAGRDEHAYRARIGGRISRPDPLRRDARHQPLRRWPGRRGHRRLADVLSGDSVVARRSARAVGGASGGRAAFAAQPGGEHQLRVAVRQDAGRIDRLHLPPRRSIAADAQHQHDHSGDGPALLRRSRTDPAVRIDRVLGVASAERDAAPGARSQAVAVWHLHRALGEERHRRAVHGGGRCVCAAG